MLEQLIKELQELKEDKELLELILIYNNNYGWDIKRLQNDAYLQAKIQSYFSRLQHKDDKELN